MRAKTFLLILANIILAALAGILGNVIATWLQLKLDLVDNKIRLAVAISVFIISLVITSLITFRNRTTNSNQSRPLGRPDLDEMEPTHQIAVSSRIGETIELVVWFAGSGETLSISVSPDMRVDYFLNLLGKKIGLPRSVGDGHILEYELHTRDGRILRRDLSLRDQGVHSGELYALKANVLAG